MTELTAENLDINATAFGLSISYTHGEPILALGLALKLHYTAWDYDKSDNKLQQARAKANRLRRHNGPVGVLEYTAKHGMRNSMQNRLELPLSAKEGTLDSAQHAQELSFAYDGGGLSAAVAYVRLATLDYPTGWNGKVRVVRCIPQHKDEIIELDFLNGPGQAVALSCVTSRNPLDIPLGHAYRKPTWYEHLPSLLFHQGFGGMTLRELNAIRYWG